MDAPKPTRIRELRWMAPTDVPPGADEPTEAERERFERAMRMAAWLARAPEAQLRRAHLRTHGRPMRKAELKEARSVGRRQLSKFGPSRTRTRLVLVDIVE